MTKQKKQKKRSMIRKSLSLTLNNLEANVTLSGDPSILPTKKDYWLWIKEPILNLYPNAKLLAAVEYHRSGKRHAHVYIELKPGISKNTYIKVFRKLFPNFEGHELNITGVTRKASTVGYILKMGPENVFHTENTKLKQAFKLVAPDTLPPSFKGPKVILEKGSIDAKE